MRTSTFLRIASVITLLFFAGHTAGIPWTPDVGTEGVRVIDAMKGYGFDAVGSMRTYWDFYYGFGVIISLYLLMQAVLLWQIASLAKTDALRVRPIVATFCIAFIINSILAWKYFFVIPLVTSIAISVCLAFAFITAGRSRSTSAPTP
jgi:hypothetical protein